MDGESGMWQMEVMWVCTCATLLTGGSAGSYCWQQLTRGECSLTGPAWPAAFPTTQQHQQLFSFSKKVLTSSTESAFFRSGH